MLTHVASPSLDHPDPSDPDEPLDSCEDLIPYEPGYPDGKGPLREAFIRRVLAANPDGILCGRRLLAILPTLRAPL